MTDRATKAPGKPPSKVWLYLPFALFGLICIAYTGYWFFVKGKLDQGVNDFIAQQREAGADLTFTSKRLHGYPFRFALTVDDLRFVNPDAGFDWKGETLQINMQPWNFSHAILRSSGRNEISLGDGQDITALIGKKSALSLNWDDTGISEAGLTLDTADIVIVAGDIALKNFKASIINAGTERPGKRILIDWDGVTLSENMIADTDVAFLGTELQASRLRLEGQGFGVFGEAEDRKVEIAQLLFNWGPLKLGSKGQFDVNDLGYPDGTLQIRLDDAEALGTVLKEKDLLNSETSLLYGPLSIASKEGGFFPLPLRNGYVTMLRQELAPVPQIAPALDDIAPPPPVAE